MNLFEELDRCLMTLEGYMGTDRTNEFLKNAYGNFSQKNWRETLRAHRELLSDESRLYRVFGILGYAMPMKWLI